MESLVVTPISQAAANQRAGRAGRTSAGKQSLELTLAARAGTGVVLYGGKPGGGKPGGRADCIMRTSAIKTATLEPPG